MFDLMAALDGPNTPFYIAAIVGIAVFGVLAWLAERKVR